MTTKMTKLEMNRKKRWSKTRLYWCLSRWRPSHNQLQSRRYHSLTHCPWPSCCNKFPNTCCSRWHHRLWTKSVVCNTCPWRKAYPRLSNGENLMSARSSSRDRTNAPPQRVISKIRFWGWKNWSMLQPVDGQLATGIPKVEVSIVLALLDSELGICDR